MTSGQFNSRPRSRRRWATSAATWTIRRSCSCGVRCTLFPLSCSSLHPRGRHHGREEDAARRTCHRPILEERRTHGQGKRQVKPDGVNREHRARTGRDAPPASRCERPARPRKPTPSRSEQLQAGRDPRRQGPRLPHPSLLPAQTPERLHHPGEGRPGPQPHRARLPKRATTEVRQERPQRTPCRGVRHQPAETPPGGGHAIRRARGPPRGDRAGRGPQRVVVTSAFTTEPGPPFLPALKWPAARDPRRPAAGARR